MCYATCSIRDLGHSAFDLRQVRHFYSVFIKVLYEKI